MAFDPALAGYASSLANAYIRKLDVINRGFSGYNTDWALPLLPQILPKYKDQSPDSSNIKLMTIFFGANDAALPGSYQHVPIERYVSNTKYMINMVRDSESEYYNPEMRLILITPPPVCEELWKKRCEEAGEPLNRKNDYVQMYAKAIKKIGEEMNVCVVDIWSGVMDASETSGLLLSHYLSDGLHLNANGYEVNRYHA
ncbi:SGNH hydrolase-type esterase domain-containing protein [Sporodiniella umbellata]|nr:SGNH hydrolase-type esterase domain-containing protein [Sporodiniella umbellata]